MFRTARLLPVAVLFAVALATNAKAYAWNATGHRVVAYIAYLQLTESQRGKIVGMIRNHERFDEDFKKRMPQAVKQADRETRDLWVFLHASTWPDIARGFKDSVKDKFHRSTWHYINQPVFLTDADRRAMGRIPRLNLNRDLPRGPAARKYMNVVQAIKYNMMRLRDRRTTKQDQALGVCWVMHLTGDLHQPMHSTALFTPRRFRIGDLGGNRIPFTGGGNLHSRWDGFLGRGMKLSEIQRRGRSLLQDAELKAAGTAAARSLKVETWLDESHRLAKAHAYAPQIYKAVADAEQSDRRRLRPIQLPDSYFKKGGAVARKRVVEAGFRLAEQLKSIAR